MADPNPYLVPLASLGLDPDVLARVQAIANQRIPKGNNRSAGAVLCLLHGELFEAVAGKLGEVRGG